MGSAGSETDARSVCRLAALMSPFPSPALSPWHPGPMEDGVTVRAHCQATPASSRPGPTVRRERSPTPLPSSVGP